MEVHGQLHATAALPPEKKPYTYSIGGWVELRAGADDLEKRGLFLLYQDSNP
jgi:hypothetical protein